MQFANLRLEAHRRLSAAAMAARASRPGLSPADAFELVCLRNPDDARLFDYDERLREGRGLEADRNSANRKGDELSARLREYARGSDGKLSREKLTALAVANGVKRPSERQSVGSIAGSLGQALRTRQDRGQELVWPGA
jgi:hypothetical protein